MRNTLHITILLMIYKENSSNWNADHWKNKYSVCQKRFSILEYFYITVSHFIIRVGWSA